MINEFYVVQERRATDHNPRISLILGMRILGILTCSRLSESKQDEFRRWVKKAQVLTSASAPPAGTPPDPGLVNSQRSFWDPPQLSWFTQWLSAPVFVFLVIFLCFFFFLLLCCTVFFAFDQREDVTTSQNDPIDIGPTISIKCRTYHHAGPDIKLRGPVPPWKVLLPVRQHPWVERGGSFIGALYLASIWWLAAFSLLFCDRLRLYWRISSFFHLADHLLTALQPHTTSPTSQTTNSTSELLDVGIRKLEQVAACLLGTHTQQN